MFNTSLAEPQFGRAKRIRIWNNGDRHGVCHAFMINPNRFRTWNSILGYIGRVIQPENGPVRKLMSLTTKKSVYCFKNLDPEDRYVAVGKKGLVMIENGYKTQSERDLLRKRKQATRHYSGDFLPPKFRFLQITKKRGLTIIYVVVNKLTCQTPVKIVLNEKDFKHWDVILEFLANQLDIPNGIQGLYTIFGTLIDDPLSLQHGYVYVALPCSDKFFLIDYMQLFDNLLKPLSSYMVSIRPSSKLSKSISRRKSKESVNSRVSSKYKNDSYSHSQVNKIDRDIGSGPLGPQHHTGRKSGTSAKSKSSSSQADNSVGSTKSNLLGNLPEATNSTIRRSIRKTISSKTPTSSIMPRIVEESDSIVSLTRKNNPEINRSRPSSQASIDTKERIGNKGPVENNLEKRDSTTNTQLSLCSSPSIEVSVKSSITVGNCQAENICDKSQEWKCKLTPCSHKECTCQTDKPISLGPECTTPTLPSKSEKTMTDIKRVSYGMTKYQGPSIDSVAEGDEGPIIRKIDLDEVASLKSSVSGSTRGSKKSNFNSETIKAGTDRIMQTDSSYLRGLVDEMIKLPVPKERRVMAAAAGTIYLDDERPVVKPEEEMGFPTACSIIVHSNSSGPNEEGEFEEDRGATDTISLDSIENE